MRVAIIFDEILPQDVLDDKDVMQQVDVVVKSLKRLGHKYVLIPCTLDLQKMKDEIEIEEPDVIFNLMDTLDSQDSLSHLPVAVLDAFHIPHTGPTADILSLTTRKLLVKERLQAFDIPTPREINLHTTKQMSGKWIIKGSEEDGSFGMTDASVVTGDTEEIKAKLQNFLNKTGHVPFAEEFIDGREFTVPFLCGKTLPVAEITYVDYPPDKPRILAQAAKWDTTSFESNHTGSRWDFEPEDTELIRQMQMYTEACIYRFNLNGWGRIDYRVTDKPFIIDVNSNSSLAIDAWWYGSAMRAGISFDTAMQMVMDEALQTKKIKSPTAARK